MKEINGSIEGIKRTLLEEMAGLYELREEGFAPLTLLERLAAYTAALNREISVYLTRDGRVVDISIGDSKKVSMPELRVVRNQDRLAGVRCIHTHPGGNGQLSTVDIGTLKSLRLDSMCAVGVEKDGKLGSIYAAFIGERLNEDFKILLFGPLNPLKIPQNALMKEILEADKRLISSTQQSKEARPERAILVGLEEGVYDTLSELSELAKTAGAEVVSMQRQKRSSVDNATYVGKGKAEELSLLASSLEADIFIFDDELSAIQLRNLEEIVGRKVIDRTALILDIFAANAKTREGRLQVELAQMKYRLPRLIGLGKELSRLGGGIGTRGPGEKKLEIDRRRIRRRIFELEQEIQELSKQRALRRDKRERNSVPVVALVGYTNAGKSTLLNAVSGSDVLAEDKLFATLDPVVRSVKLPGGTEALFSDTVGFINKLPHELVDAFRSTLEEVSHADLILHVIDASSSYFDSQIKVVEEVLDSIGAGDKPRLNIYNKRDKISETPFSQQDKIYISALNLQGLDDMLKIIEKKLNNEQIKLELLVPYSKYDVLTFMRARGRILSETHEQNGIQVNVLLNETLVGRVKKMLE